MTGQYNPRSLIDGSGLGDPYILIDEALQWLLTEAKKQGYMAQVKGSLVYDSTTRFAVNQVTQHTDNQQIAFDLTLSKNKHKANVSTSGTSRNSLEQLYKHAKQACSKSPEIPFFQGFPSPRHGSSVDLSGKDWSIEERADAIVATVNSALSKNENVRTAGTAQETKKYIRIVSTEGVDVEDANQRNYFKVNAICGEPDERGYGQEEINWRYETPNFEVFGKLATQTALDTIKQIDLPAPKDYEVLLSPLAFTDVFSMALFSLDAPSYHESRSYSTDKIGAQVFDPQLTIHNSPRNPKDATYVANYDDEGLPTENNTLFDKGVLKFIPYSSFHASKYLQDKNLASGLFIKPFNYFPFPFPLSGVVEPGTKSFDQQLAEVENGLLVKNFWYIRFTIRREGGMTGLTRNGLFHVKNGEIQGAVRNLRFTESFVKAFGPGNIISLSNEHNNHGVLNAPYIHLKRFHFSSVAHSFD